jgi:hypothetical protein
MEYGKFTENKVYNQKRWCNVTRHELQVYDEIHKKHNNYKRKFTNIYYIYVLKIHNNNTVF